MFDTETMIGQDAMQSPLRLAEPDERGAALKVCLMVDNLVIAGIETQILQLIRRFDRRRITPYLCLLDGAGDVSRALEPTDCRVERLGVKSLHRSPVLRQAVYFTRFLRREKIDIVHPHFPDSMYFAAPLAKLAGVPCVVRFRVDTGFWFRPIHRRLSPLYNRWIDATLVNCEACRDAVIQQERAPQESISIIRNGIDLERYRDDSQHRTGSRLEGPRRVGIVANLRQVKGLDIFIRAAALLIKRGHNVQFQIAGEGELRGELEALIRELKLTDRIELLGRVDDVPSLLRGLDVAVLSSRSEGLPNVVMEYMAAGKAIVATNVGGVCEVLTHEESGLVVPPNDESSLADGIQRLLVDEPLADRLATTARRRALAEYGLETQVRRYEQFYRDCVVKKKQ